MKSLHFMRLGRVEFDALLSNTVSLRNCWYTVKDSEVTHIL